MDHLAGQALRKVMQTVRSSFHPAQYRGPEPVVTSRKPVTRARMAEPGEIARPPKPRSIMPAYYEMSHNFKQSRRRFWALLALAVILLVFFVVCLGLGIQFRR